MVEIGTGTGGRIEMVSIIYYDHDENREDLVSMWLDNNNNMNVTPEPERYSYCQVKLAE